MFDGVEVQLDPAKYHKKKAYRKEVEESILKTLRDRYKDELDK